MELDKTKQKKKKLVMFPKIPTIGIITPCPLAYRNTICTVKVRIIFVDSFIIKYAIELQLNAHNVY